MRPMTTDPARRLSDEGSREPSELTEMVARAAFTDLPHPMYLLSREGVILTANPAGLLFVAKTDAANRGSAAAECRGVDRGAGRRASGFGGRSTRRAPVPTLPSGMTWTRRRGGGRPPGRFGDSGSRDRWRRARSGGARRNRRAGVWKPKAGCSRISHSPLGRPTLWSLP